jgi:excisionase family DNA binding protein
LPKSDKDGNFLSRKETVKLLHISLPTLNEWTKDGTLTSYRIRTRVLYKNEEVLETVTKNKFYELRKKNLLLKAHKFLWLFSSSSLK